MPVTVRAAQFLCVGLLTSAGRVLADPAPEVAEPAPEVAEPAPEVAEPARRALGVTVDVLPIALSAVAGHVGASGQIWFGVEHVRLRAVAARVAIPDFIAARDGFEDLRSSIGAFIVDYTFGPHFDGFWVGSGFEYWRSTITYARGTRRDVSFGSAVWTLGGGYTWVTVRGFYIEPWAAAHLTLNHPAPRVADAVYHPQRVQGEVSLKLGYIFDL